MTRVKICGITNLRDAWAAQNAGADAIGFVFAKSPRRVSLGQVKKLSQKLAPWMATVGVFVNEDFENIARIADECRLSAIQLHGDETPSFAKKCSRRFRVIKAFRMGNHFDLHSIKSYDTDAFLFDAQAPGKRGGTGTTFNWAILKGKKIHRPFIISGGLTVQNVKKAIRELGPYGVDASSGLEAFPGQKDAQLVKEFVKNAKST